MASPLNPRVSGSLVAFPHRLGHWSPGWWSSSKRHCPAPDRAGMPAEAEPVTTHQTDTRHRANSTGLAAPVVTAPVYGAAAGRSRWEGIQPAVCCHAPAIYPPRVGRLLAGGGLLAPWPPSPAARSLDLVPAEAARKRGRS